MLQFVGCGSAANTALGNNGAYRLVDRHLFLIDCGSANFHRLRQSGLLAGADSISVLLTHLHPDHAGSLGDLILYSYFKMEPFQSAHVTVITPQGMGDALRTLMRCVGVGAQQYRQVEMADIHVPADLCGVSCIESFAVEHVPALSCYGYVLTIEGSAVYYSGDANMIPAEILARLRRGEIARVYHDTCSEDYAGNVHMSLRRLQELIPADLRSLVYCMHLDEVFDAPRAAALGFNWVAADALRV